MTATVKYVTLNDTLKLMRAELKREFPATKFSITRARGTAYGYVDVRWTDGPSDRAVSAITRMYEGEGFDGMTDSSFCIEHTEADANGSPIRVQYGTRGIITNRNISPAFARKCLAQLVAYWGQPTQAVEIREYEGCDGKPHWDIPNRNAQIGGEYVSTMIYRAAEDATRYARGN